MTTRKDKLVQLAEQLMTFGSKIFDMKGPDELMPMIIGEDDKGQQYVIGTPFSSDEEKPLVAKTVRQFFIEKQVLRYALLSEGWSVVATPEEANGTKKIDIQVKNHEDRRECLTVVGNDGTTDVFMCRYILRPKHGKPCLSPVESHATERKHKDFSLFGSLLTTVE